MSAPARTFDVVLVLSGGNALGAFEAGIYEALHQRDLLPDWVIGTSIGAINGALIVGSAPERRVDTLRGFWRPDGFGLEAAGAAWFAPQLEVARRTAAVGWTLAAGRPGVFGPLLSSLMPWTDDRPSMFETDQLVATLEGLVDFARLNDGACRYTTTAVDLTSGEDVTFDTRDQTVDARHIRASAALPVAFPPVEVDGRWLVDGGLSANLPLDPLLAAPPARPTLCIAADLLPLGQPLPRTLGEAASRMQDLTFAAQSRRTIARWQAVHADDPAVSVALARVAYVDQRAEVAGKAFDFSGPTIARRWAAGRAAGELLANRVDADPALIGRPGLTVVDMGGD